MQEHGPSTIYMVLRAHVTPVNKRGIDNTNIIVLNVDSHPHSFPPQNKNLLLTKSHQYNPTPKYSTTFMNLYNVNQT